MSPAFSCLVLTPWYRPHQVIAWQESIALEFVGKADVLERYDETVSSPTVTIRIPAVARLVKSLAKSRTDVKFSRTNIYQRDGYRCGYCDRKLPPEQLNYDHVLPRAQGGKTSWDNIVTSCLPCNSRKDNRTPAQAKMRLIRTPHRPKSLPMSSPFLLPKVVPEQWMPYLADRLATLQTG